MIILLNCWRNGFEQDAIVFVFEICRTRSKKNDMFGKFINVVIMINPASIFTRSFFSLFNFMNVVNLNLVELFIGKKKFPLRILGV